MTTVQNHGMASDVTRAARTVGLVLLLLLFAAASASADPSPTPGSCCAQAPVPGLGCDDAGCMACVCNFDSYCCNVEWDFQCSQEAQGHDYGLGACNCVCSLTPTVTPTVPTGTPTNTPTATPTASATDTPTDTPTVPTPTPTSTATDTPTAPTSTPTPTAKIDIFLYPATQNRLTGQAVTVEVRANTHGLISCAGGAFIQFDTSRLSFTGGANNVAVWGLATNAEPAVHTAGIVALSVGSGAVNSVNVIVSTLHFTATADGTANLTLLFNAGMEETQFYAADCLALVDTTRTDAVVVIGGTPTPGPSATATPPITPIPTNWCCQQEFGCVQGPTACGGFGVANATCFLTGCVVSTPGVSPTPTSGLTPIPLSWCCKLGIIGCTSGGVPCVNGTPLPDQMCMHEFGPQPGVCQPGVTCHNSGECGDGFACIFPTSTLTPTRTPTSTPTHPTFTPTRTFTQTPTITFTPTVTPTGIGCCHLSGFGCSWPPPFCDDANGFGATLAQCESQADIDCIVDYFTINALCSPDCPTPLPTATPTITGTPTPAPTCIPNGELCTDATRCCAAGPDPCIMVGETFVCNGFTKTPTNTPTDTPTPANTGTPTPLPPIACCQCEGPSCGPPDENGQCGTCVAHPGLVCEAGACVTPTPLPLGSCCQFPGERCGLPVNGFCPLGAAPVLNAMCSGGSCVLVPTPTPTP